jgi:GNAT superfamily N-acetyltransferase
MAEPLTLRLMTRDEVDWWLGLPGHEGWNPGLHDADTYWAADPEGLVAAEIAGELIGGGAIIRYGGSFGALGHVVVHPQTRGRGIEDQLWRACLQLLRGRLQPGATIGLDGVSQDRSRYVDAGFVFSHRTIRYETTGAAGPIRDGMVPADGVGVEAIAGFDGRCFPVPRKRFVSTWLQVVDGLALACRQAGRLRGYGVIRRSREGARLEPLLADDAKVAENLLDSLLTFAPHEPVFLDVPETNAWAMALARRRRMHPVSSRGRLYRGPAPRVAEARIFGDSTFSLG